MSEATDKKDAQQKREMDAWMGMALGLGTFQETETPTHREGE